MFDSHIEVSENLLFSGLILESNILEDDISLYPTGLHLRLLLLLHLMLISAIQYKEQVGSRVIAGSRIRHKVSIVTSRHASKHNRIDRCEHSLQIRTLVIPYEQGTQVEQQSEYCEHDQLREAEEYAREVALAD